MVIGECPSESRQLPVGFPSTEPLLVFHLPRTIPIRRRIGLKIGDVAQECQRRAVSCRQIQSSATGPVASSVLRGFQSFEPLRQWGVRQFLVLIFYLSVEKALPSVHKGIYFESMKIEWGFSRALGPRSFKNESHHPFPPQKNSGADDRSTSRRGWILKPLRSR
jgi:hypothetical protein